MSLNEFNREYNSCMDKKIRYQNFEFTARDIVKCNKGGLNGFLSRVWVLLKTTRFDSKRLIDGAWLNPNNIKKVASMDLTLVGSTTSPLTNRLKLLQQQGQNLKEAQKPSVKARLDKIEQLIKCIDPEQHGVHVLPGGGFLIK